MSLKRPLFSFDDRIFSIHFEVLNKDKMMLVIYSKSSIKSFLSGATVCVNEIAKMKKNRRIESKWN